ncbi:hypothetical protein [Aliikangiella coralliicola]|uniref:Uncharacterized protein n=1 Tax=Aliikangiella coralliicola TaxID=2592383 RepID=A0A545UFL7_9GAMM|nr:hypothetical protein [Aliikangiella coralliicola]TQV88269.1 hypothetical protein FLL46_07005 [Aliikangiella coralliicola]
MYKLVLSLSILFISFSLSAEDNNDICLPLDQLRAYKVSDYRFGKEQTLEQAIVTLLEYDIKAKRKALDWKIPNDWSRKNDDEYANVLRRYDNGFHIKHAKCLLNMYKSGDKIREFEVNFSVHYQKGFVLLRNEKIVAIVILEDETV